ncbi:hypothetical protein ACERK3_16035 [Phycisphaerales bacterium AB-hyl4]|uniref:PH (Pleckstrin Homology) domain-containing protein n=1 Tax=Natronomicrosphaera hydrolytica TaxID=3242702 RepID=A0ABV4U937_9BACT
MDGSNHARPDDLAALMAPPPTARATLDSNGEDVTIRLKPLGFMATNPDLLWQGPAVIGLWLLGAMMLLNAGSAATAFFFIVMLPTLTLPLAWFMISLHRAIQQAVIDIVDDRLVISCYGVFGLEQDEWPIQRLRACRVVPVPSVGWSLTGSSPALELQLETRRGMQHSFFAGRDELELRWLAHTLEQLVGIPPKPDPTA